MPLFVTPPGKLGSAAAVTSTQKERIVVCLKAGRQSLSLAPGCIETSPRTAFRFEGLDRLRDNFPEFDLMDEPKRRRDLWRARLHAQSLRTPQNCHGKQMARMALAMRGMCAPPRRPDKPQQGRGSFLKKRPKIFARLSRTTRRQPCKGFCFFFQKEALALPPIRPVEILGATAIGKFRPLRQAWRAP